MTATARAGMADTGRIAWGWRAGVCGRVLMPLLVALALLIQALTVQTHVHLGVADSRPAAGAGAHAPKLTPATPERDGPACAPCRALSLGGGAPAPHGPRVVAPAIVHLATVVLPFSRSGEPQQRSHAWRGRAPPTRRAA